VMFIVTLMIVLIIFIVVAEILFDEIDGEE
jgi:hypothetical protein